jgi:hypothetical protein
MLLGASALGRVALGGGYDAVAIHYVDCASSITITSSIQCALSVIPAAAHYVNISASIAMFSALTASLMAAAGFPNAGVSFTMTDKAGGV